MPQALIIIGEFLVEYIGYEATIIVLNIVSYALTYELLDLALGLVSDDGSQRGGAATQRSLEVALNDGTAPAEVVYGRVRKSGVNVLPPWTSGSTGQKLSQVLALAGHEVANYRGVYLDADLVPIESVTTYNPASAAGGVNSGSFKDQVRIRTYPGWASNSQFVDYELKTDFPTQCDSWFRGAGIGYAALTYEWNDGAFWGARGIPNVTVDLFGAKVYDPRRDTSPGANPTSATYKIASNNPALCWADFKINTTYGRSVPTAEIDWNSVVTAANICDTTVAIPGFLTGALVDSGTGAAHSANADGSILVQRNAGVSAWDASVRGTTGYTSGRISFAPNNSNQFCMVGWNTDPATDDNYTGIDYCFYLDGSTEIQIRIPGSAITLTLTTKYALAGVNPYDTSTVFAIDYDGSYMRFLVNGQLVYTREVPTHGATYYFDNSLNTVNSCNLDLNVERRYTCNGVLSSAADPNTNERRLLDTMMGRMSRKGGQWFVQAGGYTTPSFVLDKSDFASVDAIQVTAPRDDGRFNGVRTYYLDPARNWQRVESYPRYNDTYKSADAGERIWLEMEQPMCTSEYEAQRKGEFMLRASRNGTKLSGLLPPKFMNIATYDTITLSFAELGWVDKPFRVSACTLISDGSMRVALNEEQNTDWADLLSSEYNTKSDSPLPFQYGPTNYPGDSTYGRRYIADPDFALAVPTYWSLSNTSEVTYKQTGGLSGGVVNFASAMGVGSSTWITNLNPAISSGDLIGTLTSAVDDVVKVSARFRVNSLSGGGLARFTPRLDQFSYSGSYSGVTLNYPPEIIINASYYTLDAAVLGAWTYKEWYIGLKRGQTARPIESLSLNLECVTAAVTANVDLDYFNGEPLGFRNTPLATVTVSGGNVSCDNANAWFTQHVFRGGLRSLTFAGVANIQPIGSAVFVSKPVSLSLDDFLITHNTSFWLRPAGGGVTETHTVTLTGNAFYDGYVRRINSWDFAYSL